MASRTVLGFTACVVKVAPSTVALADQVTVSSDGHATHDAVRNQAPRRGAHSEKRSPYPRRYAAASMGRPPGG